LLVQALLEAAEDADCRAKYELLRMSPCCSSSTVQFLPRMMSTKVSLSAVSIVSLSLLTLSGTGCQVSGSGLGGQRDAADGPQHALDGGPTYDASTLPPETGVDRDQGLSVDGVADRTPDTVLWKAAESGSDHVSSPADATPGLDLALRDANPVADVPFEFEVETSPDGPLLPPPLDGPVALAVDGPGVDTVPADSTLPDLAPADQAQDLPGPDRSPADVAPQPTVNWVVDNTTSIGGFTPTVLGSPTVTTMDAGTAVCFDGTMDGLVLATNPIQGMQRFTVETLVYPEFTGTLEPRLIHIGGSSAMSARLGIQMHANPSGTWHALIGFFSAGIETDIEDTAYNHPANQWYWLAVTYDGQTARVYVNGVLENSFDLTFNPMPAGSTSLGTRQNGQYYFPGCMRDVEFFNSALPASQLEKP